MARINASKLLARFAPDARSRAGKCKVVADRLNAAGLGPISWKAAERWLMRNAISRDGMTRLVRLAELEGSPLNINDYIEVGIDDQTAQLPPERTARGASRG